MSSRRFLPPAGSSRSLAALFLSASGLALATAAPAIAQTTSGAGRSGDTKQIETVTVTATKVRTNLQKTPIAVTTLSGRLLDQANIAAPRDLDNVVPGMVVNTTPSNPLAITIRGAGYEGIENTSAQPGVSYNQNGVYIASPTSLNANFLDVDDVEVLRGPQGTVLGQNSDGGAINVTTVAPKLDKFSGYINESYGSYNYERLRTAVNVPIGHTVAVRLALQQQYHDGWGYATEVPGTNGHYDLGDEDSVNGRVDILWKPNDRLTFDLWAEHYQNNYNGDAFQNIYDPSTDPRVLTQDFPSKTRNRADNVALNVGYDLGFATARFIGSYQEGSLDASEDLDKLSYATALPIFGVHDVDVANYRDGHSYTAEFDLTSKPGSRLDWIVGAFYLNQRYNEAVLEYQYNNNAENQAAFNAGDSNTYAAYGLPLDLSTSNPYYNETANFNGPVAFETRDTQTLHSASAYAQGTFHITNRLRITAGGRGTIDNQEGVVDSYFNLADRGGLNTFKTSFQRLTGKIDVEYDVRRESTLYASASTGIKPGGVNLNPIPDIIATVFRPETVIAFELGSKNQFFDRRTRVNLSAFYNIVHNFQVDTEDPLPFQGGLTNVGRAHVYGLEAEGTQLLPYRFRIDGNMTLQASGIDSHDQLFDPEVAQEIDRANGGTFVGNDVAERYAAYYNDPEGAVHGNDLPHVPSFTFNLALRHTYTFTSGATLNSSVQFSYRNPYYFRIYNNKATDLVPAQRQVNLAFTYTLPNGRWHGDFLVINLANSNSVNSRYVDNFGVGAIANYYVPPRQFIGRIGYTF